MLKKTRDKKWVLPNFQREFVWTADQIAGLFDSMARGYPIGAIILLKYHADYPFEARGLGGEEGAGEGHEFYIIDGQQRLTSLYKIINQYSSQAFDEESANHLALKKKPNSLDAPQNYTFFSTTAQQNLRKSSSVHKNKQNTDKKRLRCKKMGLSHWNMFLVNQAFSTHILRSTK
jgi:Uncharacterized conserved protein